MMDQIYTRRMGSEADHGYDAKPNMCCRSIDYCGLNRMGKRIRKNGFSAFVMQNLRTATSLMPIGFRNLDQRAERQRLKKPIVCIHTLPRISLNVKP
jgi:hypothetical protein